MRAITFPPALLAAVQKACETEPALLNSERIEQRFGSYGVEALPSEHDLRRSSLYSLHAGKPVCRTYAVVSFADPLDERFREAHAKVLAGNSIGAIFRSHGWDVHKQTMHIGNITLPDGKTTIGELMHVAARQVLALHAYQLLLVQNNQIFEYATITETHHPDYLSETDLHDLYNYNKDSSLPPRAVSELVSRVLDDRRNDDGICRAEAI